MFPISTGVELTPAETAAVLRAEADASEAAAGDEEEDNCRCEARLTREI